MENLKGEKNGFFGKYHTEEFKLKKSQKVKQIDKLTGKVIKIHDSMTIAAKEFELKSHSSISCAIKRKITARGFYWAKV